MPPSHLVHPSIRSHLFLEKGNPVLGAQMYNYLLFLAACAGEAQPM
ncbi:MAG: hypothetical protein ABI340_01270 [Nitrososphaera sp.]